MTSRRRRSRARREPARKPAQGAKSAPPLAAPKPAPASGSPAGRSRTRLAAYLASAALILGALASATNVVDWVDRTLFGEDPPPPPPPPKISTKITAATYDGPERLGAYLKDTNQSTQGLTRKELREEGLLFRVSVSLTGSVGKDFPLRWAMYDEARGRLGRRIYNQTAATFTPASPTHERTVPIWSPYPPRTGTYTVRFTLIDAARKPVFERRTAPFVLDEIPELD
jgi:hypothetical protein